MVCPRSVHTILTGFAVVALSLTTCGCNPLEVDKFFGTHSWFDPSEVIRKPARHASPVNPIWEQIGSADQTTELVPNSTFPRPEDMQYSPDDYILGPADILRVTVLDLYQEGQETALEMQVSQSGYITLPLAETRVKAGGLTQDQLIQEIRKVYEPDYLKEATVTVTVLQPRQNIFSVLGAVSRPGSYNIFRTEFTLLEALAMAGDVSQTNIDWIYVIRNKPHEQAPSTGVKPRPSAEPLPPLPGAEGTASQPSPGQGQPKPTGEPGSLENQLKDLERLIPGASAQRRRDLNRTYTRRDEVVHMSAVGGDVTEGSPAVSPASASAPASSWVYENGKWVKAGAPGAAEEPAAQPAPGAPAAAPASQPATPAGAEAPANANDPYGWARYSMSENTRIIAINLPRLKAGDPRLNIIIRNQDIVQVPTLEIGEFYVMGEVLRPGAYTLTGRRITVKQAVASAGNFGQLSWPANTVLIRRVGRDQEQMVPLDLNAVFAGKEPDIFLKPDDVIAVGSNWSAPFLAVWRNAFRLTYGFGFIYDRNYSEREFELPGMPRPWYRPTSPQQSAPRVLLPAT